MIQDSTRFIAKVLPALLLQWPSTREHHKRRSINIVGKLVNSSPRFRERFSGGGEIHGFTECRVRGKLLIDPWLSDSCAPSVAHNQRSLAYPASASKVTHLSPAIEGELHGVDTVRSADVKIADGDHPANSMVKRKLNEDVRHSGPSILRRFQPARIWNGGTLGPTSEVHTHIHIHEYTSRLHRCREVVVSQSGKCFEASQRVNQQTKRTEEENRRLASVLIAQTLQNSYDISGPNTTWIGVLQILPGFVKHVHRQEL